MADNITVDTLEESPIVAADDVGGVKYERIKVDLGGDGASSPLVRGQQADADSIPVSLSTEQAAFLDGIETLLSAVKTATEALSALVSGGALKTDDDASQTLLTAIDGHVDGLEAGVAALLGESTFAATLGEVQASPTANTVLDRLKAIATALAATLTVSGSVTANAGTDLNTSALALESGGNLEAAASVLGATDDAAASAGGTGTLSAKIRLMTTQLASLVTAAQLIDDIVAVANDDTDAGNPLKIGGRATTLPSSVSSGDRVNAWFTLLGAQIFGMDTNSDAGADGLTTLGGLPIPGATGHTRNPLHVGVSLFNGTGWDRMRGDTSNGLDVDVTRVPADPFGAAADAAVNAGATGSLSAKLRSISRDLVANIVLAAGANRIGKVTVRNSADGADIDPLAEATFTGRIGEVQASPTSNTVLDRLKQLLTGIVLAAGENMIGKVAPNITTIKTSVTRPNDTNAYATGDTFADSTSAPTSGGFMLSNAARSSGGSGKITDAIIGLSGGEAMSGELWIFDQAATAKNDNAAFDVSDSDLLNLVAVIPFACTDTTSSNSVSYVTGLDYRYTCVGSANLRFLVKVMAGFTPTAQSKLSICLKVEN